MIVFKLFCVCILLLSFNFNIRQGEDFRRREGSFQGIFSKDFTIGQLLKGKFFTEVNI